MYGFFCTHLVWAIPIFPNTSFSTSHFVLTAAKLSTEIIVQVSHSNSAAAENINYALGTVFFLYYNKLEIRFHILQILRKLDIRVLCDSIM